MSVGMPIPSPSAAYSLAFVDEVETTGGRTWTYWRPHINDRAGRTVYVSPERFAGWFRLAAAWDEHDRAWVASADTGTVVFTHTARGWTRAVWRPECPVDTVWDAANKTDVPVVRWRPPDEFRGLR